MSGDFQFLGTQELSYGSVNDFIDNRPTTVRRSRSTRRSSAPASSTPIGFAQDSWRVNDRLTLELGLRYDYYSPVKEADSLAKPFFIEENEFGTDVDEFYNADKNNWSPRLSAAYSIDERTVVRGGFGLFYGPGQFEDRIQPIENYIARRRRAELGRSEQRPAVSDSGRAAARSAAASRLHAQLPERVQRAVRRQRRSASFPER